MNLGTYDLRGKGDDALEWLQVEAHPYHHHEHADDNRHGDRIRAHAITLNKPITPLALAFFIDTMKLVADPALLRVKGLLALADDPDRPVVIYGVQHLIHPIDRMERWHKLQGGGHSGVAATDDNDIMQHVAVP